MQSGIFTKRTAFIGLMLLALLIIGAASTLAQDDTPFLEGEVTYTVQVADTLDKIGALFDVKVECIAELNALDNIHRIFPGDELIISDTCPRYGGDDVVINPREDASPAFGLQSAPEGDGQGGGGDQVWVVGIGDTLDTIGQALNVSVVAVQVANEIEAGDALFVGQELIIPADAPAYGLFPALTEPPGNGQGGGGDGEIYVVQPRDTLDLIGARLNVQVTCVAEANELANINRIFPGQALLIPGDCPEYDGVSTP
jgi:LysM repeat protein